jgi:hypothetical protein
MKKFIIGFAVVIINLVTCQSAFSRCIVCYYENANWHCFVLKGKCGREGCDKFSDGWDCCKNLSLVSNTPPIIRVKRNGSAFLFNGNQITQLASDKFEAFISKNNKPTKKQLVKFFKSDDGVVSKNSLFDFAKDLNATIIKTSKQLNANYCPACEDEKVKAALSKTNIK